MKKLLAILTAICMLTGMTGAAFAEEAKWSEEVTADGWIKVTNEGGKTLGYSPDSGVKLIEVDGYAFKDLDKDGELDVYEDWREDYETRAHDLADQMSAEEIMPYLTHGGWGTITTDKKLYATDDNEGYTYLVGGGRAGIVRSAGSSTEENVNTARWINIVQALCEENGYGIPGLFSIDPNSQSGLIQCLAMAATMDPELAFEVGKAYSEQYRAMGVDILLGPQVDVISTPVMARASGALTEDPALARDIAEAFISGLQSTFDADGNDLGWGEDSVISVVKHFVGGGADEQGGDDHNVNGKYSTFPNGNYEAHLIPFIDGAFHLTHRVTGSAAGVMPASTATYSDGEYGEIAGSLWSKYKMDMLKEAGFDGMNISDWVIWTDERGVIWGVEDLTVAERTALGLELGMTQTGGWGDLDSMQEAWEVLVDDLDEEEALELVRDAAYRNIYGTMILGLFENPYNDTDRVRTVCYTDEAVAYALQTQLASIVMLKNDGIIKPAEEGAEKLTAYIPYGFAPAQGGRSPVPASVAPSFDLDVAAQYYNIVTDAPAEPSGTDADGNAVFTENDIVRASAEEIAACDIALVGMKAPFTEFAKVTDEEGNVSWLPPSLQYAEYTAMGAREESISGDIVKTTFFDGYYDQTEISKENRSYNGNTAPQSSSYSYLVALQNAKEAAGDKPVVVVMNISKAAVLVWTEVEPLADAIVLNYGVSDEAALKIVAGEVEPSGLLVEQMPASMAAVEAQTGEDVPRDMEVYVDANGNAYDFAFGLNWSGVIDDARVQIYSAEPLTTLSTFEFHTAE